MQRTIVVKGIGNVSVKPDYIVISMRLKAQDIEYDRAMDMEAEQLAKLKESLISVGFDDADLKTEDFDVNTDYDSFNDDQGIYQRIFKGYVCSHSLKLSFDFNTEKLSETLSVISKCLSNPDLYISFTVKDKSAINDKLLHNAAINAKEKATILCSASEVELGQLLAINYNWGEIDVYSTTKYDFAEDCRVGASQSRNIDFVPEDIDMEDTVTYTWEIK